jgi:predicted nuclease with TOPRIM domain
MKDREWTGLMKIPSEVVIKEMRIEMGKLYSEVDELSDSNKKLLVMHMQMQSDLANKQREIDRLEAEVKRQQRANTKLLKSILKLKYEKKE